jgi:hypothetical protein
MAMTDKVEDGDAQSMTAFLTGLVAGSLIHRADVLTQPVTLERHDVGILELRLASGMLATITVHVA